MNLAANARRARPQHEAGGYRQGRRDRARHAEQGRRGPVPRQGELSVARQAARELLGAARDADGRQGSRPRDDPRSRRRGARRLRARGPALSRTCSARCGTARTSRRSPTTTARTTSGCSSRARSTTCCSTTARKGVVELAHEKGRKITFDDDGFVGAGREGQHRQGRQQQRRDDDRGQGTAQHQGRDRSRIEATGTLELKASATLTVRGSLVNIN